MVYKKALLKWTHQYEESKSFKTVIQGFQESKLKQFYNISDTFFDKTFYDTFKII
jgi:hypothetical protein